MEKRLYNFISMIPITEFLTTIPCPIDSKRCVLVQSLIQDIETQEYSFRTISPGPPEKIFNCPC